MPAGGSQTAELSQLVAKILDDAWLESGLTQGQLGAAAGISQSQVSKYLRGTRVPDIDKLDALCDALGLDVAAVVAGAQARRGTR
ncbi:helix-turn-helix transcriptional regulator [Microbacterium sp. CFH 90308]|uniref:Helix-turn-helix transcriptional regulator n=1 Tax=Microbacterium salsuginis TaxID=2722803 RepID=A0ABX1K884_9MICO|nr:helix-turn-helix transcriptional regulator [Microbacterium sp. CFH 90308]